MQKTICVGLLSLLMPAAFAQFQVPGTTPPAGAKQGAAKVSAPTSDDARRQAQVQAQIQSKLKEMESDRAAVSRAERDGVGVRLDALCHFRGAVVQQLLGVGLVTGLDATGDSQSYTATAIAAAFMLKKLGMGVDTTPSNFQSKNIALVTVTANLPAYSTPGQAIDITVSAMGDSKSLRNGTLIFTPLKYPGSDETYATASGPVSVGGYSASGGGSKAIKGFVTVGKIPGGAIVQKAVATNTVIDGKLYLDLDQAEATTAQRIQEKIQETFPELSPIALGAGTIELTMPAGQSPNGVESKLMQMVVQANTEARVVVDERTGTIVIGGNVRVAPCAIARGSINVTISEDPGLINLPGAAPNQGSKTVTAQEDTAQVTMIRPNTTVADLAEIFQTLHLHADDIIAILENMRDQGALKGKLVTN